RYWLELNFVSGVRGDLQGRSVFPTRRKPDRGRKCHLVSRPPLRIKQDLVPTDNSEFVGRRSPGGEQRRVLRSRAHEIEACMDLSDARRHLHIDRPIVVEGTPPLQNLAITRELQSGQVDDWAAGCVLTGNPLGVIKSQSSRARWN